MTDWLGDNAWALWLSLAFLLAVAEILSLDLVLIMLAVGALAGAGVAVVAPGLWWLQILVAAGVSVGMLLLLRPTLMARVRNMPGYRSSTAKMVGSSGVAVSQIDRSRRRDQGGRAELDGPAVLVGPGDRAGHRDRGLRDRRGHRRGLSQARRPAVNPRRVY